MKSIVIGGSGLVGGYIVQRLILSGERPFALSTLPRKSTADIEWFQGDLTAPDTLKLPPFTTLYCTALASRLASALPYLFNPSLERIVVITSSSIVTKIDSEIKAERLLLEQYEQAERQIISFCERMEIHWTILRPTLIYAEGRDLNITLLSRLIQRFGFVPLAGMGLGLRQPVHAEDVAIGAVAAAHSTAAKNKIYALPGTDTVTYREMVGRIFDGLDRPRRVIPTPPFLWRFFFSLANPLFPHANAAMGTRMAKNMIFDPTPAIRDFGWNPRAFRPQFT
jgi:nucleoside-diphosphate-sugar epimerase